MSSKKKTVLVTGSSSGIGEATARFLAQKGWTVFAGVRKEADAQKLRSVDINIKPVIVDVAKEDQVRSAIEEIKVAVGEDGLDALVNNAGLSAVGPLEFAPMDEIKLQYEVNLFGVVRMIQAAMPLIRLGTHGRIVNIGSTGSEFKMAYSGAYNSTKSAIIAITESLRREVARFGIKVVMIQPGPVQTNIVKSLSERYEEFNKRFPEGSLCNQYYGKDMKILPKATAEFMKSAVEPVVLARRVHQALIVKHPKNLYYDTWSTWMNVTMVHWMPYSWTDSMFANLMKEK